MNDNEYFQAACPRCGDSVPMYGIENADIPTTQDDCIVDSRYCHGECGMCFMVELYFRNDVLEIKYAIIDYK